MQSTEIPDSRIDPADVVILFADLQAGVVELTKTNPIGRLRSAVLALAKLARLFDIPVVVSGVTQEDGSTGKVIPEVRLARYLIRQSSPQLRPRAGRRILISGVATELAVQLPG